MDTGRRSGTNSCLVPGLKDGDVESALVECRPQKGGHVRENEYKTLGCRQVGKAQGFDPCMRRFESCHPSHISNTSFLQKKDLKKKGLKLVAELKIFSGNAHIELATRVVDRLRMDLGAADVGRFSDGEVAVEIHENVRGKDVFVIQPTCAPTNDNLMELMIIADCLQRASAARITAVIPYFGYARQDRRVRSARVPITAKVVADMLGSAGINRVLTIDLHADQIQGFFEIPVDNIYATPGSVA